MDVKVGDYVYAQGGILINRISEREAQEVLSAWRELFFELKGIDEKLAKIDEALVSKNLLGLLQKVNLNQQLNPQELLRLLALTEEKEVKLLYDTANNIRQREHGNACCVHGIIEFSNYCRSGCFYCGIRSESSIERYRMEPDEIIKVAQRAVDELGFKALVLQSGEDTCYDEEKLTYIVREIRNMGVLVFLSIGTRSKELYEKLYDAGARAALLRFETSNEKIFKELRPSTALEDRLELIKYLKELGYVLATGFIIGLPHESDEDLINNI